MVGQGEEAVAAEGFQRLVEAVGRVRSDDGVVDMIHRELCHTPLQGQTLFMGAPVGKGVQTADDGEMVCQPLVCTLGTLLMDGRGLALAVVVGVGIGGVDGLGTNEQLGRELLVLAVFDAWREQQLAAHRLTEKVATGRAPQVFAAHQGRAARLVGH
jgi:hypothetical protein